MILSFRKKKRRTTSQKNENRAKSTRAKKREMRKAQREDATVSEEPPGDALAIVPHGGMAISVVNGSKKPRGGGFSISKNIEDSSNMLVQCSLL